MFESNLLKVIKKAPREGLDLLVDVVSSGVLTIDHPVGKDGVPFVSALHELAIASRRPGQSVANDTGGLYSSIYGPTSARSWIAAGLGSAMFSTRLSDGKWVPLAVLATLPPASDLKANSRAPAETKAADQWLRAIVPCLDDAFWQQAGGELLAVALEKGLNSAANDIWSRIDPLAPDHAGHPALLRAWHAEVWNRYTIDKDPSTIVDGKPLWSVLLNRCNATAPNARSPFLRGFEDWLVSQDDPVFAKAIETIVRSRLSAPRSLRPDQWIKALSRCDASWPHWPSGKTGKRPAWLAVALAHPAQAMFEAFEQSPDLMSLLPRQQFLWARFAMALGEISAVKKGSSSAEPLLRLISLVEKHGWQEMSKPLVVLMSADTMSTATAQTLGKLARSSPRAWWGPEDEAASAGKKMAMGLTSRVKGDGWVALEKAPSREQLDAWVGLCDGGPSPWIPVATGFASSVRGGDMANLFAVPLSEVASVLSDPQGEAWLLSLRKYFSGDRRTQVDAWLQAARLELNTAPAPADRPRPAGLRL